MNENLKKLISKYKGFTVGVPQSKLHHPEGDVFVHTRLVRKNIDNAIKIIQSYKEDEKLGKILFNLDVSVSEKERKILYLCAWLHDVGKYSATTIDNVYFKKHNGNEGKIRAIEHETCFHFKPIIEILKTIAPSEIVDLYNSNMDVVDFVIKRHMDFAKGGFSKRFISEYFINGSLKNEPKLKLLLILKWADQLGRLNAGNIEKNVNKLILASEKSIKKGSNNNNKKEFSKEEFILMLKNKGLSEEVIGNAVERKFKDR